MTQYENGKPARPGTLNIGLSYYQEMQWLSAICKYGDKIMGKSLLSIEQKEALLKLADTELSLMD